jgi:DNA-binding NarL/FixJ family response regulator
LAILGVAEKTIEDHVTALLEKAQVESRSALVAKVWTG